MSPTTTYPTAMAEFGAPAGTWALVASLGALLFTLMLPTLAIALCVTKWPVRRVDDEISLGSVSLHDELWEFIGAVERGDVSLASLGAVDATAAADGEAMSEDAPTVNRGKLAS